MDSEHVDSFIGKLQTSHQIVLDRRIVTLCEESDSGSGSRTDRDQLPMKRHLDSLNVSAESLQVVTTDSLRRVKCLQ